jgi:hypothetical protein
MKLKEGVKLSGIQPQTVLAMQIVNSIYNKHLAELVITSVSDGLHKQDSKHYKGMGFDCRTHALRTRTRFDLAYDIRDALGDDFDVVLEKDHLHVEYDPKIV